MLIAQLLAAAKATTTPAASAAKWTVVHAAAALGLVDVLQTLMREVPRDVFVSLAASHTEDNETVLPLALRRREAECAQLLVHSLDAREGAFVPKGSVSAALACIANDLASTGGGAATARNFGGRNIDWTELLADRGGDVSQLIDLRAPRNRALLAERGLFRRLALLPLPAGDVAVTAATPIAIAALLGSVSAVSTLLSRGARADCLQSVAAGAVTALSRRRSVYATAAAPSTSKSSKKAQWNASSADQSETFVPDVARARLRYVSRTEGGGAAREDASPAHPRTVDDGAASAVTAVVSPLVAAIAMLSTCVGVANTSGSSSSGVLGLSGSVARQRRSDARGYIDVIRTLIRAGGLRPEQVSVVALAVAALRQWELLDAVLEEGART
ncbi:MAG: hypothetical protein Q8J97_03360, partial [Flavobacteriaceae bacterium]|nr:hypothetical protein [Flavobacteriaceae bacterium]